MKIMRHTLGVLLAIVLVAFALPASAADKLFGISTKTFSANGTSIGGVIPAGNAPSVLLIDFFNQSPPNTNSVFKSIQVAVPSDVSYKVISGTTVNGGVCGAPPTNPPATNAGPGGTLTLNGLTGVKVGGHFCLYLAVTTSSTSCTSIPWGGQANTGQTFGGGQPFIDFTDPAGVRQTSTAYTTDGCTGILGCDTGNNTGGNPNYSSVAFGNKVVTVGPVGFGIARGANVNSDTQACVLVPYQFTIDQGNGTANFNAMSKGNQIVAVEYFVMFPAVAVETDVDPAHLPTGWTQLRPRVSWNIDNPDTTANSTDFIPALACTTTPDTLVGLSPAQLGALLPQIPALPNFTRDSGTYPQYQPGMPAKVCIAQQGWTAVGLDDQGHTLVQYWVKVIDEADSWIIVH